MFTSMNEQSDTIRFFVSLKVFSPSVRGTHEMEKAYSFLVRLLDATYKKSHFLPFQRQTITETLQDTKEKVVVDVPEQKN